MARFVHHFAEWAQRSGPFGTEWQNFKGFDPDARRAATLRARVAQIADEDDTSEAFARRWIDEYEGWHHGLHTYRLCFFSNFLTPTEVLERFQDRVSAAFSAVTPGGVVDVARDQCVYSQCDR